VPYPYPLPPARLPLTYSAARWAHLAPLVAVVVAAVALVGAPITIPFSGVVVLLLWLPVVLIRLSRSNRGDALVRNHTAQSLNSIITGYVALAAAIGVTVLAARSSLYDSGASLPRDVAIGAAIAMWAYWVVCGVGAAVFAIIGATRARAGLFIRFPIWVAFRLVPDSARLP